MPKSSAVNSRVANGYSSSGTEDSHQVTPISQVKVIEDLISAAQTLSSQTSFKEAARALDDATRLRSEVTEKNEEAERTAQRIEAMTKSHKAEIQKMEDEQKKLHQKLIETHEDRANDLRSEKKSLMEQVSDLEKGLTDKEESVAKNAKRIRELERDLEKKDNQVKAGEVRFIAIIAERDSIDQTLKNREAQRLKLQQALKSKEQRVLDLEGSLAVAEDEKKKTGAKMQGMLKERSKMKSYTKELHSEDPKTFVSQFENLCKSTYEAVITCFNEDLSESILKNPRAWQKFSDALLVPAAIPLPQSNSKDAKNMRVAVTLRFLAEKLTKGIFSLTYLFEDDSEIRRVLLDQVELNPEKETLCRALLLTMFPQEQEITAKDNLDNIVWDVSGGIKTVVSPSAAHRFEQSIRAVVKEALSTWQSAQRCKGRIEADMNLKSLDGWKWHNIELLSDRIADSQDERTEGTNTFTVVFPRVFLTTKDGYESIFPGLVLSQRQTSMATNEMERMKSSGPAATRRGSIRNNQTKGPKVMASASQGSDALQDAQKEPFLGREGS